MKTPKNGEASAQEVKAAKEGNNVTLTNKSFPIDNKVTVQEGKMSDYPSTENAYRTLRDARSEARNVGKRAKRAKAKEEEAAAAKK